LWADDDQRDLPATHGRGRRGGDADVVTLVLEGLDLANPLAVGARVPGARQLIPVQIRGLRVARNSLSAHRSGRGRRGGGSDRGERHGDRKSCGESASEVLLHRDILLNSCGDRQFTIPPADRRLGTLQLNTSCDYES